MRIPVRKRPEAHSSPREQSQAHEHEPKSTGSMSGLEGNKNVVAPACFFFLTSNKMSFFPLLGVGTQCHHRRGTTRMQSVINGVRVQVREVGSGLLHVFPFCRGKTEYHTVLLAEGDWSWVSGRRVRWRDPRGLSRGPQSV